VLDVVASATPAVSLYESAGWMKMGEVSFAAPGLVINELVFAAPI
jgi:hypothetical protein